jgi:hypothetical protein
LVKAIDYSTLQTPGLSSRKRNKRIKLEDQARLGGTDRNVSSLVNRDAPAQDVVNVSSLVILTYSESLTRWYQVLDKIHKVWTIDASVIDFYIDIQAIVDRVTGKIKSVKANVQHGRAAFLGEAAADLYDMCAERSVQMVTFPMTDWKDMV